MCAYNGNWQKADNGNRTHNIRFAGLLYKQIHGNGRI